MFYTLRKEFKKSAIMIESKIEYDYKKVFDDGFHTTGKGGEVLNLDEDGLVPMFEPIQWDQSKWDGSDIFNIEDTGIKACTQRVKEILEKAKITNLEIKPL